jgi:hypothetical protein
VIVGVIVWWAAYPTFVPLVVGIVGLGLWFGVVRAP